MKTRYTKMESRAILACDSIRECGRAEFGMEWRPSRTWGRIAVILWRNEKVSEASGCGYDKESAALANFLRFLATDPAGQAAIHAGHGAGFCTVQEKLNAAGWILRKTYSGKWEDGFSLERKENGNV